MKKTFAIILTAFFLTFGASAASAQMPVALETQAWELFDSVDAAVLLPADKDVRVEFVGYNRTGFPNLEAKHLVVWDNEGNFYLFEMS